MSLTPGTRLGPYEIVSALGAGGMGEVYRARDTKLNRLIALKVLPADMAADPDRLERFRREARAVAALSHPNIVTIHSVEEGDGVHFLTLELVDGRTLEKLIAPAGMPIDTFFKIAIPLVDAVASAHEHGVVHRDLKPANVMVTADERVKVLDFGLAKLFEPPASKDEAGETVIAQEHLTGEGRVLGTVAYMSPEQAEAKPLDHRSDIFSLGVMLFEMATGDRPFKGDTQMSVLTAILRDAPSSVTDLNARLPVHLARIIRKALEKPVTRRYQTALDLRNDLEELKHEIDSGQILVSGTTISDPEMRRLPVPAPPSRSMALPLGLAAAVVLTGAGAAWWFGAFGRAARPAPSVDVRQITTSATDGAPAISPDGQWIAFTRFSAKASDIFLQSLGDQTAVQLTRDMGEVFAPAFSPNGTSIAFSHFAGAGGISVMGRMGGNVRRLTDRGFNPTWSPDGTRIAFGLEPVWGNAYFRGRRGVSLAVVEVATGTQTDVKVVDGVQPSWSPHGHRLAFWGADDQAWRDIYTVRPDGSDPVRVTNDVHVDYSPVWSHDGQHLYFASTRGGPMSIWRVPIDENTGQTSGDPEQITSGGLTEPGLFSLSADGRRLVYQQVLIQARVEAADFDAKTLQLSTARQPIIQGSRRVTQLDVSPDSEWLVYRTDDAKQDIYVVRTDGKDLRQVTDDFAKQWAPRWSPDSRRLAFYSNESGRYQIWVINRDGSGRMRLTDVPAASTYDPVWSPDGKEIIFLHTGIDSFILKSDVAFDKQTPRKVPQMSDDGKPYRIRASDWNAQNGKIAADGVRLFSPAAGTFESLVKGAPVNNPRWLIDGRRLYYDRDGQWMVLDTVTRTEQPIQLGPNPDLAQFVLSPDSRRAYLLLQPFQSDVWMMEIK